MRIGFPFALLALTATQLSCSHAGGDSNMSEGLLFSSTPSKVCGDPLLAEVRTESGSTVGLIEVANDSGNVWVTFTAQEAYELQHANLQLGTGAAPGHHWEPMPSMWPNGDGAWLTSLPTQGIARCFDLQVTFQLRSAQGQEVQAFPVDRSKERFSYCLQSCRVRGEGCSPNRLSNDFCTVPPAFWSKDGGPWHGYLLSHFDGSFPNGLHLGCTETLALRTAEDALDLLLKQDNTLAMEVCALSLALGFDATDAAFSNSTATLSELEVAEGEFEGWSLSALLEEANSILGKCPSNYSSHQMIEVLRRVNGNFSDAGGAKAYLKCPES